MDDSQASHGFSGTVEDALRRSLPQNSATRHPRHGLISSHGSLNFIAPREPKFDPFGLDHGTDLAPYFAPNNATTIPTSYPLDPTWTHLNVPLDGTSGYGLPTLQAQTFITDPFANARRPVVHPTRLLDLNQGFGLGLDSAANNQANNVFVQSYNSYPAQLPQHHVVPQRFPQKNIGLKTQYVETRSNGYAEGYNVLWTSGGTPSSIAPTGAVPTRSKAATDRSRWSPSILLDGRPIVQSEGLASTRLDRKLFGFQPQLPGRNPQVIQQHDDQMRQAQPHSSPSNVSQLQFVQEDPAPKENNIKPDDPGRRNKGAPSDANKQKMKVMIEHGGACIDCSSRRKPCSLKNPCEYCALNGLLCIRGHEVFCFLKVVEVPMISVTDRVKKGSRESALDKSRTTTFEQSDRILRKIVDPEHFALVHGKKIVLQIRSHVNVPDNSPPLTYETSTLATNLFSPTTYVPVDLIKEFSKHVSSIESQSSFLRTTRRRDEGEISLVHIAETMCSIFAILQSLPLFQIYAITGKLVLARALNCYLCSSFAKSLAQKAEELCKRIRWRLRLNRGHHSETRYVIGLYYRVVEALMAFKTNTLIDDILEDLKVHGNRIMTKLEALFEKTQQALRHEEEQMSRPKSEHSSRSLHGPDEESAESPFREILDYRTSFRGFIDRHIPQLPRLPSLHLAVYLIPSTTDEQFLPFNRVPISVLKLLERNAGDRFASRADLLDAFNGPTSFLPNLPAPSVPGQSRPLILQGLTPRQTISVDDQVNTEARTDVSEHPSLRSSQQDTALSSDRSASTILGDLAHLQTEPEDTGPLPYSHHKLYYEIDTFFPDFPGPSMDKKRQRSLGSEELTQVLSQPETKKLHLDSDLDRVQLASRPRLVGT